MHRSNTLIRQGRLVACTAMAVVALSGCTTTGKVADAGSHAPKLAVDSDAAIAKAEARVARSPKSGAARAELAQLYLGQGRFASAVTTFEDAVSLGQTSPKIGLSLTLAYAGAGNDDAALATLERWKTQIPASDYGLALALAGQPDQAVAILTDVVRGGQSTPKTRQNLAYAYALGGHWGEARVIAMQDVPADQLDARLTEWAARSAPSQSRMRVAALLGTTPRIDPGQPAALALNTPAHGPGAPAEQFAAAQTVAPVEASAAAQPAEAELPAVHTGESFWGANLPEPQPEARPAPIPSRAQPKVAASSMAAPIVHTAFKPAMRTASRVAASTSPATAKPAAVRAVKPVAVSRGSHLAQLGAFASRDGAEHAKAIFLSRNPALKDHAMRITEADVNGKHYFRLAAAGFDRDGALALCGTVKRQGGVCLAMADRLAPVARPSGAPMLAQR